MAMREKDLTVLQKREQLKCPVTLDALLCSAFETGTTWIFRIHCSGHLRLAPQRRPHLLQHCFFSNTDTLQRVGSVERTVFL